MTAYIITFENGSQLLLRNPKAAEVAPFVDTRPDRYATWRPARGATVEVEDQT